MIDTYIIASDLSVLTAFCDGFKNVLGPSAGREAVSEYKTEEGVIVPAQEAAGDPAKWYACVRAGGALASQGGVEVCDPEEGAAVVGIWL